MFETLYGLNKVAVPPLFFQAHQICLFPSVCSRKPISFLTNASQLREGCHFPPIVWSVWIKVILDKLPPKFPKLLGEVEEREKGNTISHWTHTKRPDSYNLQTIFGGGGIMLKSCFIHPVPSTYKTFDT